MARYAYGLTLPDIREDLRLSELVLGLVASATFAGYLAGLLLAGRLAARRGSPLAAGRRSPRVARADDSGRGLRRCGGGDRDFRAVPGAACRRCRFGRQRRWLGLGALLRHRDPIGALAAAARALAISTTGTSGGLVLLGALAVLAAVGLWRLVWAGIALAAVAAALVNLRLVPRTGSAPRPEGRAGASSLVAALRVPVAYSVVYFAVVVVYFTYAADVLDSGTLPAAAVPALYAALGLTGMVGVATGTLGQRLGSVRVAALCLATVGAALVLLGLAGGSVATTAPSAGIFGMGYMTGSAVLAVWTAELVPERAGAAFTACLVVGALSSVAARRCRDTRPRSGVAARRHRGGVTAQRGGADAVRVLARGGSR